MQLFCLQLEAVGGQNRDDLAVLAFAMKNRHFGGECPWILAGKARKCGRFWVFACVPNPGKQSIWRQHPPSARKQSTKKLPNRPSFTHVQLEASRLQWGVSYLQWCLGASLLLQLELLCLQLEPFYLRLKLCTS